MNYNLTFENDFFKFYSTFSCVLNRVTNACEICFNALHLSVKTDYVYVNILL